MKLMTEFFFQHLEGITWCQNILMIYQRPPKAAKRSIKAVFKICTTIGRKKLIFNVCWALTGNKLVQKLIKGKKKMIKGHQRPIKIGKVCYKWMLLNSKQNIRLVVEI